MSSSRVDWGTGLSDGTYWSNVPTCSSSSFIKSINTGFTRVGEIGGLGPRLDPVKTVTS